MLLYSIRQVSDGRYFIHTNGLGHPRFSTSPIFWKTSESIHKNLKRLCSEFLPKQNQRFSWCWSKEWVNFDPSILPCYEVVIYNVDVLGTETISAKDYVSIPDLNKLEVGIG